MPNLWHGCIRSRYFFFGGGESSSSLILVVLLFFVYIYIFAVSKSKKGVDFRRWDIFFVTPTSATTKRATGTARRNLLLGMSTSSQPNKPWCSSFFTPASRGPKNPVFFGMPRSMSQNKVPFFAVNCFYFLKPKWVSRLREHFLGGPLIWGQCTTYIWCSTSCTFTNRWTKAP